MALGSVFRTSRKGPPAPFRPSIGRCARTSASQKEAQAITRVERIGMEYKNIIGSQVRKRRSNLGLSQAQLAIKLQIAGFDVDRSQVSKIECRLVHVSDFQMLFLSKVLKVPIHELYPPAALGEPPRDYVPKAMRRLSKIIPRKKTKAPASEDSSGSPPDALPLEPPQASPQDVPRSLRSA